MTDKTDALLAQLDDYLQGCPDPNKVWPKWMVRKASRLLWACREALAAQPVAMGEAPKGGVMDGFDTWFDEYSKQNYDDYMLAHAAWNASSAASVDVEWLRDDVRWLQEGTRLLRSAGATQTTVKMQLAVDRLLALIDSAGGAKGEPFRNMKDGATFEEYRDQLAVGNLTPVDQMAFDNLLHDLLTPQPAEGDGAVTAPYGYEHDGHFWFAPGATPWVIHHATPLYTRPPAAAAVPEGCAPSIAAAEAMGAHGAPSTEGERLAFEAWMRGHCWALCATWSGTEYRSDAEQDGSFSPDAARTRMLWAAWRDRAALVSEQASAPKGAVVDEATQKVIDNAHENYLRGNIDATTRDYLIEKAKSAALATPRAEQGGQEVGNE